MTDPEFREQYRRLTDVHKMHFSSKEKMDTIWGYVQDLDVKWFSRIVDSIVMATDVRSERFDIGFAARAERNAKKAAAKAREVSDLVDAYDNLNNQGLEKVLEEYKSGSLLEAVQKSQKGDL